MTMKVYTINTIGGQITGNEAIEEEVPAWLYNAINDTIKKNGFCYYSDENRECVIYLDTVAAQKAIDWTNKM